MPSALAEDLGSQPMNAAAPAAQNTMMAIPAVHIKAGEIGLFRVVSIFIPFLCQVSRAAFAARRSLAVGPVRSGLARAFHVLAEAVHGVAACEGSEGPDQHQKSEDSRGHDV